MRKVEITIRRPEGNIEVVDASAKFYNMNDALFATIKKDTAAAGRGECLSYKVTEAELSAEQKARIDADDKKAAFFARHACAAK